MIYTVFLLKIYWTITVIVKLTYKFNFTYIFFIFKIKSTYNSFSIKSKFYKSPVQIPISGNMIETLFRSHWHKKLFNLKHDFYIPLEILPPDPFPDEDRSGFSPRRDRKVSSVLSPDSSAKGPTLSLRVVGRPKRDTTCPYVGRETI